MWERSLTGAFGCLTERKAVVDPSEPSEILVSERSGAFVALCLLELTKANKTLYQVSINKTI